MEWESKDFRLWSVKFGFQSLVEQAPGLPGRAGCLRGFDRRGELLRGGVSLASQLLRRVAQHTGS